MMDEQDFKLRSDESLTRLYNALGKASERHDFETDFGGSLTVEFEDPPAKFVVSPNTPVRQIWISALSTSFKLDWDPAGKAFILPRTAEQLTPLVDRLIAEHLEG